MIKGKCHCESVKYESKNNSKFAVFCHCETCRQINGSAFGSSAAVPKVGFFIISGENFLEEYESSPGKIRHFCTKCGTHVYATSAKNPEYVMLRLGCIEGNHDIFPTKHIWVSHKAPWYEITNNLPMYEEG